VADEPKVNKRLLATDFLSQVFVVVYLIKVGVNISEVQEKINITAEIYFFFYHH